MKALAPRLAFPGHFGPRHLAAAGFAAASLILAVEPVHWLVSTWLDPSYQSTGAVYMVAILALLAWSVSSPVAGTGTPAHRHTVLLLGAAALLRLISQVAAINVIGGLALALDVFALLTLLRTGERERPLSPFWIAALFLFTLPVERILQRALGYPMQQASALGACEVLGLVVDDLACSGVRIRIAGADVLVDLPCSGTEGLMLVMAVATGLTALYRPRFSTALFWLSLTALLGVAGNILRISLLALGIAHKDALLGLDVMAQPAHAAIGYATIALSLLPVVLLYKPRPVRHTVWAALPGWTFPTWMLSPTIGVVAALAFLAFAGVTVALPRQALDVSRALTPAPLPQSLAGEIGRDQPLEPVERLYFEQYGGKAQKALYGPLALTLVHTTSPLRHLHTPDDCLRGLGYRVTFLGSRFSPLPTALYRAEGPDGDVWHVAVSFLSPSGQASSNIAETIWLWLKNPGGTWTSIQRITPWTMPDSDRARFEAAAIAALDLPTLP